MARAFCGGWRRRGTRRTGPGSRRRSPTTPTSWPFGATHHRTRAAIAAGHQQIFDTIYRGSTLRYSLTQARRLADGVILAHASSAMDAPSGPHAGAHQSTATLVLVRTADGWKIAAFHNTLVQGQPSGPPSSRTQ